MMANRFQSDANNEQEEDMTELLADVNCFLQSAQSNNEETSRHVFAPVAITASCEFKYPPSRVHDVTSIHNVSQLSRRNPSGFIKQRGIRKNNDDNDSATYNEKEKTKNQGYNKSENSKDNHRISITNITSQKVAFPQVLHMMLETAKSGGYDDVVSWQQHGRAFLVKDKERFVTTVMPRYFNQTKYRSFQRQLALYGFIRINTKNHEDFGAYRHEHFLQGHPDRVNDIRRTPIKGYGLSRLHSVLDSPKMKP